MIKGFVNCDFFMAIRTTYKKLTIYYLSINKPENYYHHKVKQNSKIKMVI